MEISTEFQTPPIVCDYMAGMVPRNSRVLEPTPGTGNLVKALTSNECFVWTHDFDFWEMIHEINYDYVVMNPPFTPMAEGFRYLEACMKLSDNVIALLPWFIMINSERRTKAITSFGLKSVTHLPRKTFPGCRIRCCVIEMQKGYTGTAQFKTFNW